MVAMAASAVSAVASTRALAAEGPAAAEAASSAAAAGSPALAAGTGLSAASRLASASAPAPDPALAVAAAPSAGAAGGSTAATAGSSAATAAAGSSALAAGRGVSSGGRSGGGNSLHASGKRGLAAPNADSLNFCMIWANWAWAFRRSSPAVASDLCHISSDRRQSSKAPLKESCISALTLSWAALRKASRSATLRPRSASWSPPCASRAACETASAALAWAISSSIRSCSSRPRSSALFRKARVVAVVKRYSSESSDATSSAP
mmetsp:Transcript_82818/g.253156  ORF Transcript_82818/g.253156 Transcript_82818/m.253156 type:complete len:264 (+) Transcript_82818:179-970(+)